ncbi:MAG TPA: hypothetical protein VNO70_03885 [Blastocatellia bacterium]|nr:hypothetical protein [Blastocatellia bacterium]
MTRIPDETVYGNVETALAQVESFMPALSTEQAVARFNAVVEFVRTVMREGVDYGNIPGTDKPTLLKPGAEKLCTLFGLSSRFQLIRSEEDWSGKEHDGEPFFYYLYRCQLWRGDIIIAEGDGSCNSFEQKYRYREAQRKCPSCGQAAIIRGKEEYGGGWLCFRKRGGCGVKYLIDDAEITGQPAGRVSNENIADQVNTIQKMAQKRALIAATLLAVNGSEFFTQDNEDRTISIPPIEGTEAIDATPSGHTDRRSVAPADRSRKENGDSAGGSEIKQDLIDECANLCRRLRASGHSDFQDKGSIIKHLQQTAQARGWETGEGGRQLKALSELPANLLTEYAALLEAELAIQEAETH